MADDTDDAQGDERGPPGETPIQRALRLKNAQIAARPKPPRGGRFQREQADNARSNAKNKPWMSR